MNFTIRLPKLLITVLLLGALFTVSAQKKASEKEDLDFDEWLKQYDNTTTAGTPAKIKNSYAIWTDFDLRKKADAAAFKNRVGPDLFEQIADNCNETSGWPGAISSYEERNKVRDQMDKYVCYYIGEVDDKYVLRVPVAENKFLPYGVRPEHDIFFVVTKGDVELTGNAENSTSSSSSTTDNATESSPSSMFELFLDEEDRPSNYKKETNASGTTPSSTANSTSGSSSFYDLFGSNSLSFEQQLNKLIDALPGGFASIKGDKIPGKAGDVMPNEEWNAKIKLEGAEKTVVTEAWLTKEPSVMASYAEYSTKEAAVAKYKELIGKIAAAKINCCTMVQSKEAVADVTAITNWLTFGADGAYSNMVIEASYMKTKSLDKTTYKTTDRWWVYVSLYTQK